MFDFVTLARWRQKIKSGPVWIKSVWVFAQLYKMLRDKYANISEWFSQTNLLRAGLSLRNLKNLFFLFTLLKHYQTPSRTQAQSNRDFCSLCDHLTIIYASVFFDVDFVYIFWKFYQQRGGGKSCVKWVRSSLPNARSSRERNWKTYFPSLIGLACRSLIGSFFYVIKIVTEPPLITVVFVTSLSNKNKHPIAN